MHAETTMHGSAAAQQTGTLPAAVAVARGEWLFPIVTALVLLALTTIPYVWAQATAPADRVFMGILVNVPDHMQYFSWMRELSTAHLAANKLTPEPNAPVFFNLLWWGMGRLGLLLGIGYAGMFQLMRWVAGLLCLPLIYRMVAWFLPERHARRTAFLVAVLGAGFGWVLVLMKYTVLEGRLLWPLDVYVAEPNTFYSLMASPHFIAALLYMAVFDLALRARTTGRQRYAVLAGVVALIMGLQHAYDLLIVYGVLGAFVLGIWLRDRRLPWQPIVSVLLIGVISVWPAIYSVVLTSLDPIWKEVLAQFDNADVFTPPLYRLPVLLGPAFVLALFEAIRQRPWRLQRDATFDDARLFLHGWFWISFVLVYLPVDYQIHMLNGWQVPIAVLATMALLDALVPWMRRRWGKSEPPVAAPVAPVLAQGAGQPAPATGRVRDRWAIWASVALVVVVIPTNLYLYAWRFVDLGRHQAPYTLDRDEVAALDWLNANAAPEDVVFASLELGQFVPAHTGASAFLAHWAQTVDFFTKRDQVAAFYAGELAPAVEQALLDDYSVDWVIFGPGERTLGPRTAPPAGFASAWQQGDVTIYAR
jgi:hypothetical protein